MKAKNKFNFTIKQLQDVPLPKGEKRNFFYDMLVPGLALSVTATGAKTFYVYKKIQGKPEKIMLGRYPETTIEQARKKAHEILTAISGGENPQEQLREFKNQLTFGEVFDRYMSDYAIPRCEGWKETERNFERYLSSFRNRKVSTIKRAEVQIHFNRLGCEKGRPTANRALDIARATWYWGKKLGYLDGDNPFTGIERFKVQSRERFLLPDEMERFMIALKESPQDVQDYVMLSLLFGARQANILGMRWDQINLDLNIWRIPKTKNGNSHTLPITDEIRPILIARHEKRRSDEWVFPSDGRTGHLVEPKSAWKTLMERAKLQDLRMHDLRRTLGSYLALTNHGLPIIGKVLGHKSPVSTQIYARLADDPVRQAMDVAHKRMLAAMCEPKPDPTPEPTPPEDQGNVIQFKARPKPDMQGDAQ